MLETMRRARVNSKRNAPSVPQPPVFPLVLSAMIGPFSTQARAWPFTWRES